MSLLGNFCPYLEMSSIERKLCKIWNDIIFWQHLDSENNVLTWNLNENFIADLKFIMSLFGNFCPYLEMSSIERKLCKIWNDILFWQHLDSENNVLTWNLNMKTLLRILNSSCPYLEIFVLTWKWALLKENFVKFEMIFFFDNTLTVRIMSLLGI